MTRIPFGAIFVGAAALVVVLCLSHAPLLANQRAATKPQDLKLAEGETYTHEPSGMQYPAKAGDFTRGGGTRYDAQGHNVSCVYRPDGLRLAVTVYAYPAGGATVAEHMKRVKRDLTGFHDDAKLEKEGDWKLRQDKQEYKGLRATYTSTLEIDGQPTEVVHQVYLTKLGDFFIKYRVTCLAADREEAEKLVETFLQEMKLPAAR